MVEEQLYKSVHFDFALCALSHISGVQMKTDRRCDCWERRERECAMEGGANITKPQLPCVRGTHPWCALKARHYGSSQMIALDKTTG